MTKQELFEKAKVELPGTQLLYMNKLIPITEVRFLEKNEMILVYSENNWCCNLSILRTKDGRFIEDVLKENAKYLK
jgi:hypothetical protein